MSYTNGLDDPTAYFQANLHSGDGGTGQTLTFDGNSDLQLDLHWGKCRSEGGREWQVIDTVRGITKGLTTVTAAAEYTDSNYVTAIGSNGYSIGQNNDNNKAGETYVSYNWKAGTSFTNDASSTGIGSIDSAGSASDTSGFSIVSYSGTGSAGTIKHGLSTAPSMIIVKVRTGRTSDWLVYHKGVASDAQTDFLKLNETNAVADEATIWNDTAPTSSVFSVGTEDTVSGSGNTFVAYCFAEKKGYSKFSSYIGNGNADGNFIFTGQKSAFIMIKRTDTAADWEIYDNKRLGFNDDNPPLYANLSNAEGSNDRISILSNGFKIRASSGNLNASGGTYIFAAFASNPFTTSTGIPATAR
jgi:hypothetical protein